jgi:hypothetical protein
MTATRAEIHQRLEHVCELDPEVRFGQLIANLASLSASPWDQTLWDLEDEALLTALNQLEADLSARHQNVA